MNTITTFDDWASIPELGLPPTGPPQPAPPAAPESPTSLAPWERPAGGDGSDALPDVAPAPAPHSQQSSTAEPDKAEVGRRYFTRVEPAVQGNRGHDRLLWAAQCCIHGLGMSDDEAFSFLAGEYNPRCVPPWDLGAQKDYKDFTRKISEARKNPPKKFPYRWILDAPEYATPDDDDLVIDIDTIIENSRKQSQACSLVHSMGESAPQSAEGAGQPARKVVFEAMTAAELMAATFEIRYLVEGVLVAQQPLILAGGKKTLKTSVLADLGISLASGGYFLGKFKVPRPASVGFMTGESGLATIQETIRRICKTAGVDPGTLDRLFITDRIPRLEDPAHLQALADFIERYSLEVLAIDPAYLAMSGADAGNLFKQGAALRGITEVCTSCGVTLILAHHTRKNAAEPFALPELEDIAWAGFQEFARQWILLGRREFYEPGSGQHRLWLTTGGSAGHSGAWGLDVFEGSVEDKGGRVWETEVESASKLNARERESRRAIDEMTKRAAHDDRCKRVWEFLRSESGGATKNRIRDATGINSKHLADVLDDLLASGSIERAQVVSGNKTCDGFRAVEALNECNECVEQQGTMFPCLPGHPLSG